MTILISGASGLIGSALAPFLARGGHRVLPLSRPTSKTNSSRATWDPAAGKIDLSRAGPLDAVVHLAGENIAGHWTRQKKARIRESRVGGTRLLSAALAGLPHPPEVLICASGIGYYGNCGAETVDESASAGAGFLAEVCRDWEKAATPAAESGIRVVYLRFGLVLTAKGGALGKMLPAFRVGLGGPLGDGRQYWSWIVIDDLLSIVGLVINRKDLRGPLNVVSPNPVTNHQFTKTLGTVLRRPAFFALPGFVIRLLFGEMGKETLLNSARVKPALLERVGFSFAFPTLEPALRHLLAK